MSITEQQTVAIPTGTFQADVVHSTVAFEVGYMGIGTFNGTVKQFEASLVDGQLNGTAQIATLETKDENLLAHLLAPDFFDAERYPKVGFSTTSVSVAATARSSSRARSRSRASPGPRRSPGRSSARSPTRTATSATG